MNLFDFSVQPLVARGSDCIEKLIEEESSFKVGEIEGDRQSHSFIVKRLV